MSLKKELAIAFRGGFNILPFEFSVVQPILYTPEFSLRAMLELVLPLSITVVGIHNIQGIAILRREEYNPPVNVLTFICGIGSIFSGLMGSVTTCMTGPATAILNASGTHRSRYVGSIVLGFFFMTSALIAPVVIRLALMIPTTLISLLCGLALFRILLDSLHVAFKGKFLFGAMASFLITVSNVTILNIGAAFWGLVVGCIISLVMEPQDFRKHNKIFKRSSSDH